MDMIPEHSRLESCLSDLAKKGRPAGVPNKPMPAKEGPLWQAFVTWAQKAAIRADHYADAWRAFCAGADMEAKANSEGR
jgi:hypothetical protein